MNEPDRLLDHELALIREIVTEDVAESLRRGGDDPALRARLAHYAGRGRAMALEPQTLQVILSGQRVLHEGERAGDERTEGRGMDGGAREGAPPRERS